MARKYMLASTETLIQRGDEFLHSLRKLNKISSQIITDSRRLKSLQQEGKKPWTSFVTFPEGIDPSDTYVKPESFLSELGLDKEEIDDKILDILGTKNDGSFHQPAFITERDNFRLRVINGTTNYYSIEMTRKAFEDHEFISPNTRNKYQNDVFETYRAIIEEQQEVNFGVRYVDDCGASAITLVAKMLRDIQTSEEKFKKGVRVDFIVATPQAILLLRKMSEIYGFPLEINVGFLEFGLNNKKYITHPRSLLESGKLPREAALEIANYMDRETGEILGVGDMGNALQGISNEEATEEGILMYKIVRQINNVRRDDHGGHPNSGQGIQIENPESPEAEFYYLARGGYPFLAADSLFNPTYPKVKKIIERAARKELKGRFGVAFQEI